MVFLIIHDVFLIFWRSFVDSFFKFREVLILKYQWVYNVHFVMSWVYRLRLYHIDFIIITTNTFLFIHIFIKFVQLFWRDCTWYIFTSILFLILVIVLIHFYFKIIVLLNRIYWLKRYGTDLRIVSSFVLSIWIDIGKTFQTLILTLIG